MQNKGEKAVIMLLFMTDNINNTQTTNKFLLFIVYHRRMNMDAAIYAVKTTVHQDAHEGADDNDNPELRQFLFL
jgi:hypothetical protein